MYVPRPELFTFDPEKLEGDFDDMLYQVIVGKQKPKLKSKCKKTNLTTKLKNMKSRSLLKAHDLKVGMFIITNLFEDQECDIHICQIIHIDKSKMWVANSNYSYEEDGITQKVRDAYNEIALDDIFERVHSIRLKMSDDNLEIIANSPAEYMNYRAR